MPRKIVFTKDQIQEQLKNTAFSINFYYNNLQTRDRLDTGYSNPVVVIPILKGGIFYYVDLVRHLSFQNEMGLISTSKYANGYPSEQEFSLKYFDAFVSKRRVLLIDEICFTGETLEKTSKYLLEECGASEVKTSVLINQVIEPDNKKIIPDWPVMNYHGKEWVYGYGMDLKGLYRNLEDIVYDN